MTSQPTSKINSFERSDAPQRSPEWIAARMGRPSSSNLYRWLAVSKSDGKPLQARKDYERELAFERQFNVSFSRFASAAMEQGIFMEEFLKRQYEQKFDVLVKPVGCYYNDWFVASPDGEINADGLIECKWVYDTTFSDVLVNGVPDAHRLQIQGQLWASGRKWCDYVVGNENTRRFIVIRVERDEETINRIRDSLKDAKIDITLLSATDKVFEFDTVITVDPQSTSSLKLEKGF